MPATLGLIAGDGRFPLEIARAAASHGRRVVAVGLRDVTARELEALVARLCWVDLGELQPAFDFLHAEGVREVVMAGKVSKAHLLRPGAKRAFDARARELFAKLPDLNDASILGALADALEAEDLHLGPQGELVPDLFVGEGVLGRVHPTTEQWEDLAFGWPIARAIAKLDIGQTVVVHERAVVAVEAIEGTDEAIRRGGKLGGPGLCIVKVARPEQDPRFDLPAIGLDTLAGAVAVSAGVLAFEARRTVVLDREALLADADENGLALVAVGAEGPRAIRRTDRGSPA